MKILDGRELSGFVKERQAHEVRALQAQGVSPRLAIIRDSDNPVIVKYVNLKKRYGEDIGVKVDDCRVENAAEAKEKIAELNEDPKISGIIVQLPLLDPAETDAVISTIRPEKDVDGLAGSLADLDFVRGKISEVPPRPFDSATATAINWLLTGYDIVLKNQKIALVGRGRLVGAPLYRMFKNSGLDVTAFGRDGHLEELKNYNVIITATGSPHLITSDMIARDAVLVDAGTASEDGKLVGDLADDVRARTDLRAITPEKGGVGPLTVSALFDNVIRAAKH